MTGTGQKLTVHGKHLCKARHCVIHNPSIHSMRKWPTHWRPDRMLMERICPHGIGHPDPDALAYMPWPDDGTHGCDGCCGGSA